MLRHDDSAVLASGRGDYPIATFADAPRENDVCLTADSRTHPTGIGEPGLAPLAATIANAVAATSGVGGQELPLTLARLRQARSGRSA